MDDGGCLDASSLFYYYYFIIRSVLLYVHIALVSTITCSFVVCGFCMPVCRMPHHFAGIPNTHIHIEIGRLVHRFHHIYRSRTFTDFYFMHTPSTLRVHWEGSGTFYGDMQSMHKRNVGTRLLPRPSIHVQNIHLSTRYIHFSK